MTTATPAPTATTTAKRPRAGDRGGWLTFTAAGRIVGVSRATIAKWVALGALPASRLWWAAHRKIHHDDLMGLLDRMRRGG